MGNPVLVGLAVSSHDVISLATSTFDNVSVTAGSLPAGWTAQDIGSTGMRGSATSSAGTFTVRGAGADIWGTADAFQYAYRSLTGDGSITARVASISGTEAWAKGGVMIRQSLTSGSAIDGRSTATPKGTWRSGARGATPRGASSTPRTRPAGRYRTRCSPRSRAGPTG